MENRKTALVTGAAKGIGRQIAYCMAEAGYNVIVNYHSNKEAAEQLCREMEKFGVQTMTVYADMGKVADIQEMYRQVFEVFPVVDVLVNNAGISSEVYFLDATEEMFDQMTAIDWKGVYSAVIGDILDKMNYRHQFLPQRIQPIREDMVVAGRAMPVLDDLKENEVYICSGSSPTYALVGALMCTRMQILSDRP